MRYYKTVSENDIVAVGTGAGGEEITKAEYENLIAIIAAKHPVEEGYGYRLKTDLTWERFELPVVTDASSHELTAEEALSIILGGDST